MKTALLYARLSGRDDDETITIEFQVSQCLKFATQLGYHVNPDADIYIEPHGKRSARKRDTLKAFPELQARVFQDPTVGAVIGYNFSRLFRNTEATFAAIREFSQHNVKLFATVEGEIRADNYQQFLQTSVNAMMSEAYALFVSNELTKHYAALRADGHYLYHRDVYGLTRSGSEKSNTVRYAPTPDLAHIARAFELYATGQYGWTAIARLLHQEGVTWQDLKGNRSRPLGQTLARAAKRLPLYAPFLDENLVKQVRHILDERKGRQRNKPPQKHPPLLLQGALYCVCGDKFHNGQTSRYNSTGERTVYRSYMHNAEPTCAIAPRAIPFAALNLAFFEYMQGHLKRGRANKEKILKAYGRALRPVAPPPALPSEAEITKLARLFSQQKISADEFAARLAALTPPPAPPVPPREPMGVEQAGALLDEMPDLIEALVVASALEPEQANRTARQLFKVVTKAGVIQRVYLRGTDDRVYW